MLQDDAPFDEQTLAQLHTYLARLPEPVRLVAWGNPAGNPGEQEAVRLGEYLAASFSAIEFQMRPRRINYAYYPVLGVMGLQNGEEVDYRVRFVGLPAGYQINALIGAIQAVAFRASNIEPRTRIILSKLTQKVDLEILTTAENEASTVLTTLASGLAVASAHINTYTLMTDVFPEAAFRYSVRQVPHLVINGRYHVSSLVDEEEMLRHIAAALKPAEPRRQKPGRDTAPPTDENS